MSKKIFAIEGEWDKKLSHKESIVSILELMSDVASVKYDFRKVNTVDSLVKYLSQASLKSMRDYDFIILAFHGDINDQSIELSTNQNTSLDELSEKLQGKLIDKHVHFSSCGLASNLKKLKEFKKKTKAKRVSAYSKDVDFFESSLFDAAIIEHHFVANDNENLKKYLKAIMPKWYEDLGFVIV